MDTGQERYSNTALNTACEEESQEDAKLLISHGASREIHNRENKILLRCAALSLVLQYLINIFQSSNS
jgi:ankyrin repeat protein